MPFAPDEHANRAMANSNRVTAVLFDLLFTFGAPLFNFRSLAWHKKRYYGREEPVYFAAPQKLAQLWHLHQANVLMGFRYGETVRNAIRGRL
jgi:lysylphosphatidylglycerol synthetase-like protein (DUF2156 family)